MWNWLRNRRRRKLAEEAFPDSWLTIVLRNCRHFELLTPDDQRHLLRDIQWFVAEKTVAGAADFELTLEMQITIAAHASLMGIGFEEPPFDPRTAVIVRPTTFLERVRQDRPTIIEGGDQIVAQGSARQGGLVVLSWPDVVEHCFTHPGERNVVLHEFAHVLDMGNSSIDGIPAIEDPQLARNWIDITQAEFQKLVRHASMGRYTLLDPYGATSPAEFFAVTTETFFEQPLAMRHMHPELYSVMSTFYRQSPADWPGNRRQMEEAL